MWKQEEQPCCCLYCLTESCISRPNFVFCLFTNFSCFCILICTVRPTPVHYFVQVVYVLTWQDHDCDTTLTLTADVNTLTSRHVTGDNHVPTETLTTVMSTTNEEDVGDDDVTVEMPPPMPELSRPPQPPVRNFTRILKL